MRLLLIAALCMPTLALAAGSDTTKPPKTTKTTKSCWGKKVWDVNLQKCVKPQDASLDDDALYGAARELAYAGRYEDSQSVLAAMSNQSDDRVLTYLGFTHRKMGNVDLGMDFYQKALVKNPDNLLARSYLGQGLIEAGNPEAAVAQLHEIIARGGKGSWSETSLRTALNTGVTYNY